MPKRCLIIILLLLSLTACGFWHKPAGRAETMPADGNQPLPGQPELMPLASPQGPGRRIVQQLTAFWSSRQETLLCVLELDDRHIAMAGMTNEGLSLFNLSYDGNILQSDKNPLLPDSVVPEYMIADLQLVYWPVSALRKVLPANWRLEAGNNLRRLYVGDDLRIEVRYLSTEVSWPKNVELVNLYYSYRLRIQTISYETVPE